MSYRSKTPTVISILQRKLKPGKSFEDFQEAHLPNQPAVKNEFGYEVEAFGVPTCVINAVSAEDPSVIYSIGMSYGSLEAIFEAAMTQGKEDEGEEGRGDKLDEVCDDMAPPAIAFVGSDNDYGGKDPEYKQSPLVEVTPEITAGIKKMLSEFKKD